MKQVRIGHWPEMPPAAAAARWNELRALRETGADPQESRKRSALGAPASQKIATIGEVVQIYYTGYLKLRRQPKGAWAVYQRLVNATEAHATKPVTAVTRSFAFDLIVGLAENPVKAYSVKTELAAAWDFAMDAGRIPADSPNWWRQVLRRKLRSQGAMRAGERKGTTKRVLLDAEIRQLVVFDLALFSQQVQDFLTLQLWTCTRGAEIVQMRKEQIREEGDLLWWEFPKALTKNRHVEEATDLRVPLFGRAKTIVRRLLGLHEAWLFPSRSRGGVIQAQSQTYMQSKVNYLQPYCLARKDHKRKRLTVTHWSPHDLRRTGRTKLAALGCPHEVGEAILGHVLSGVAGDYNLYRYDKERVHWLRALDAELERIIAAP